MKADDAVIGSPEEEENYGDNDYGGDDEGGLHP